MKLQYLLLQMALCFCVGNVFCQQNQSTTDVIEVPSKFTSRVDKRVSNIEEKLLTGSDRRLTELEEQEKRIFRSLSKMDSASAVSFLEDSRKQFSILKQKLDKVEQNSGEILNGKYYSGIDSLATSLRFFREAKHLISKSPDLKEKLDGSLVNLQQLQSRFNKSSEVERFLKQRQEQIRNLLSGYGQLPKKASKSFQKYQNQVSSYRQHVNELKESLNDPGKLVAMTVSQLKKLPAFESFWKKYSMLSAMFPPTDNSGISADYTGLQTRADIESLLQGSQLSAGNSGGNSMRLFHQQMQGAKDQLAKLKERIEDGTSNRQMANQDSSNSFGTLKSQGKKVEFRTGFQTQQATNYFPVTTSISLGLAYRMNGKSLLGMEAVGKVGWGTGWKHIRISGEGVGVRAFTEWKAPDLLKTNNKFISSLWFHAAWEINYNRKIESLSVVKNYSNWSKSVVAGLSKKYSMNSPLKKGKILQGNIQVLYDFMHRINIPNTQALIWRVGYQF